MIRYVSPPMLEEAFGAELGADGAWFAHSLASGYCDVFKVMGGSDLYRTTYEGLAVISSVARHAMKARAGAFDAARADADVASLLAHAALVVAFEHPLGLVAWNDICWAAALYQAGVADGRVGVRSLARKGIVPQTALWARVCECYPAPLVDAEGANIRAACERMRNVGIVQGLGDDSYELVPYAKCLGLIDKALGMLDSATSREG